MFTTVVAPVVVAPVVVPDKVVVATPVVVAAPVVVVPVVVPAKVVVAAPVTPVSSANPVIIYKSQPFGTLCLPEVASYYTIITAALP